MQLVLVLAFFSGVVALRRRQGHKAALPHDTWAGIANALKLPTDELEVGAPVRTSSSQTGRPVFDYIAWGDEFRTMYFEQQADHLNAYHQQTAGLDSNTTTFQQRYWINTRAWNGASAKAPIFVVISPYGNFNSYAYGFVGEMSRDLGAMVVQIEGRFAPGSMLFNESGFDRQANRIGLASAENALRDHAMLISHLRDVYDPDWVCPTATFGTSLAGMYAAWLRFKFPNVVDMAVASGSPMTGYPGTSDTLAFTKTITEAWRAEGDSDCVDLVRDSFKALENEDCSGNLWTMVYYEATYYSYPPRGRIPDACQRAVAKRDAGGSPIEVALELCGSSCDDCSSSDGSDTMWGYLSCTQVVNPIGSNGVSDFFWPPEPWDVEVRRQNCMADWNIEPQKEGNYHADLFGWHRLRQLAGSVTKIIFAFGTYDAWTGFALSTTDVSPELPVVMAPGGTHGGDLIGTRGDDTPEMLAARDTELGHLSRWIDDVQAQSG